MLFVLRIFIVINFALGLGFLALGLWPNPDPSSQKPFLLSLMFVIWAIAFIGLGSCLLMRLSWCRIWTFILYGLMLLATALGLVNEIRNSQSLIHHDPIVFAVVFTCFFAIEIMAIVFMMREDVKMYFANE